MVYSTQHNQGGITLVELMVALAVSGILLAGVGIIYGNSKHTYSVDEEFAHLQENARIAMKYLVEDIRMAGNLGCAQNDGDATKFKCYLNTGSYICNNPVTGLAPSGIVGYDAVGTGVNNTLYTLSASTNSMLTVSTANAEWRTNTSGTLPGQFPKYSPPPTPFPYGPILGSDIIVIHRADDKTYKLSSPSSVAAASNNKFTVTAPTNSFADGDILIASDCGKARVFKATNLSYSGGDYTIQHVIDSAGTETPGNTAPTNWPNTDDFATSDSEVMKYLTRAYYIANGSTGPALFRHDGIGSDYPDELVEGVENMQILYGVDTDTPPDGIANRYDTANNINFGTARIVSVRISLLMRSDRDIPNYTPKSKPYLLAGGTPATGTQIKNASDQRIRKTFTTTIKLRNKGLQQMHTITISLNTQRGAALIIALSILLILTILGVSAMSTTALQERMSGNARDADIAFEAAESALRAGETAIDAMTNTSGFNGTNGLYPANTTPEAWTVPGNWTTTGKYAPASYSLTSAHPPKYMIQLTTSTITAPGTVTSLEPINYTNNPPPIGGGVTVYQVTAQGYGLSANSRVMLQSYYGH